MNQIREEVSFTKGRKIFRGKLVSEGVGKWADYILYFKPTIALKPLRDLLIPLPPLAEQHRIVAKVDEPMALCDRLEAALAIVDATRQDLLVSLLNQAPAQGEEKEEAV